MFPLVPDSQGARSARRMVPSELTLFVALLQELNFSVTSDIGQSLRETSAFDFGVESLGEGFGGSLQSDSLTVQMVKQMGENLVLKPCLGCNLTVWRRREGGTVVLMYFPLEEADLDYRRRGLFRRGQCAVKALLCGTRRQVQVAQPPREGRN